METDKAGNRYYDVEEARKFLGISRSTFEKLLDLKKIQKYRRKYDRKFYFRVEDVEAMKEPEDFYPVNDGDRTALAPAC